MSTVKAFWLISSCESTVDELTVKIVVTAMPTRARRTVALFFILCLSYFVDTPMRFFNRMLLLKSILFRVHFIPQDYHHHYPYLWVQRPWRHFRWNRRL